ncbi:hypothetical protein [Sphingosinicella sp. BN140058]|uniref:hypothetical protein n=1 Tax=Sphingosinicella sp. BN140058 TaxID=1892855 RepID=UPI001011CF1E|nr:hypothetical protein [Sphingosinicella sp. BN140058]QAY79111.1 hypothetical protein ETR14_23170 [Sphingosinicella sp. BN140058]
MKKSLLLLALVAGCGGADQDGNTQAAANASAPQTESAAAGAAEAGSTALTGLFESNTGDQKNQLCMVEKGSSTQFGLIVWGSDMHSCAGAGTAVRKGDQLSLTMTGDSSCTIAATMEGGRITLPASLPQGCAYYCGARASMTGISFTRTGTSAADASRAKDLAGDPLC